MNEIRTRFAPSPTGFMHIGNLRTALYAYLFAKKNNGRFILRIEDTDQERLVDNAVAAIYNTLKLAGLSHDEGPDTGGEYGPYVQSERKSIYNEYAGKLIDSKHAYHCFCTKERLETLVDSSGNRKYDKHCLYLDKEEIESQIAAGTPYVIRQNVPETGTVTFSDLVFGNITVENRELHDNVLIKSDGFPTYNFANVIDDHLMKISHVFRGMEYISSTPNYNLLYEAFGWEIPQYVHLPHIMKDRQHKLSKRHGDANFEDFLEKGFLPDAILNYVALLGWNPKNEIEKFSLNELIESFEISGISKSSAVFDEVKLRWLNAQYVKELSAQEFHLSAEKYYADIPVEINTILLSRLLQTRVSTVSDIPDMTGFISNFENYDISLFNHKDSKSTAETAKNILPVIIAELEKIDCWDNDVLFNACIRISEQSGVKKKALLWIIRVALTGHLSTPGGASEMCVLLGKNLSVKRLKYSLSRLENGM
ncbi:MAG: glutamate--tRNA ligase [Prevotellaceae bacterium]|jgi:glutamyl-tRNA synthetase|nr:glutamate--tRNA ligase [Prevotellaceae bacterium]